MRTPVAEHLLPGWFFDPCVFTGNGFRILLGFSVRSIVIRRYMKGQFPNLLCSLLLLVSGQAGTGFLALSSGATSSMKALPIPLYVEGHPCHSQSAFIALPDTELFYSATFAACASFARSSFSSPWVKAVISVPSGMLASLPCMNKKNGAAGQKTTAVATIPAVIPPVCPPPLASLTAR